MVDAAALIFFAYIGFDAVSTASEESKDPSKDLPKAIIGALLIATPLYIAVALVTSGLLPYDELKGSESPLADAIEKGAGLSWGADVISFGALVAITSVVLTILYGQTRIIYSMCRDGLLPERLGEIWERTKTPALITALTAVLAAVIAAFVPLAEIAKLVNIGTLFAFLIVNVGVIVLRRTKPDLDGDSGSRSCPLLPLIGAGLCIFLMTYLDATTWIRFGVWLVIGLVIYGTYGYRHSKLRGEPEGTAQAT